MKRIVCFLAVLFLFCIFAPNVSAAEVSSFDEIYREQLEKSGAENLPEQLPEDVREELEGLGVSGVDWESMRQLTPEGVFRSIFEMLAAQKDGPIKAAFSALSVMLVCALLNGFRLSFGERPLGGVVGLVGTLCICTAIVGPLVTCIGGAVTVIQGAAAFLLACVPVMAGIMIAGGQPLAASSYHLLMVGAGNLISLIASGFLVPLMNVFLAFSVVSSVSPSLNLSGLCDLFHKAVKWILGLGMTVFTSLLALQSSISTAADGAGTKAAKFVVSSFVPVVGLSLIHI